ncbi:MAG TPA: diacylglycerol kinase family protein [Thermoanaerobaculia bacterium]|jgi:diacylglycerol kinase (ATP)|nr:diacylglycerol kinase family protein [Thermoanaerobaculia bacterium]
MSVRFLVNPKAGRGLSSASFDLLRKLASRAGAGFVVSRNAADLGEQARRAAEDGVERLLVAGGDGTMHHAIQGLANTPCALGVIPVGTGNDLSGTLKIPPDVDVAVQRGLTGKIRPIDLIRVGETYSVSYLGVGFDSEATEFANQVKILKGPLIYPYSVIHTLATFVPPSMRIVHDEGVFEGRVMFTTLATLPRFGGGMQIAPQAKIDDGLLDLVIVKEISRRALLAVFPRVYAGRHVGHPAVLFHRTRKVEITIDRAMTLYGGGEPVRPMSAGEPVAAEVVPGGIRVVD